MDNIIKHEANSIPVGQRVADGYINATAMCKAAGKKLGHYLETQQNKDYLGVLASKLNVEVLAKNPDIDNPVAAIVQVFQGVQYKNQGTWIHPKAAIHLAMWLSPEFAVQVTDWVYDWMNTGKNPVNPPAPQPEQKLFGPSARFPAVTQEIFNAAPLLDQIHWAESPEEELERRRRERKEKANWEDRWTS